MRQHFIMVIFILTCIISSCSSSDQVDAYGNFSAPEWLVCAETAGKIVSLSIEEGMILEPEIQVGSIDTTLLILQRNNLVTQVKALRATMPQEAIQIEALQLERNAAQNELNRINALVSSGSVDAKSSDQYRDRIAVADGKIAAARSSLHQQSATVLAQIEALNSQLAIVNEQINRCRIINPEHGVVVAKYANQHEFVNIGMPIYRLARTDMMTFRAWFDGRTLSRINLGDMVRINIGSTSDKPQFVEGKITYISPDSEFAPATIKTVDNRSSMVYQVNVEVANDGTLKSGMPGEVFLSK